MVIGSFAICIKLNTQLLCNYCDGYCIYLWMNFALPPKKVDFC